MKKLTFLVKGSSDEPYKVTFTLEGSNLNAFCTCMAGQKGTYCKHRFGIMAGKTDALISENADDVATVASWIPGSDVETALSAMAEAEHDHDRAKKKLSAAKRNVARAMRE